MREDKSNQRMDDEEIIISLPTSALETLSSQMNAGHGAVDTSSSLVSTSAASGEPFPCFKKSSWGDRVTIKVVPNHYEPGIA